MPKCVAGEAGATGKQTGAEAEAEAKVEAEAAATFCERVACSFADFSCCIALSTASAAALAAIPLLFPLE